MLRTHKFALRYASALSQILGYLAPQQVPAFNTAVNGLNRPPDLFKRRTRSR